MDVNGGPSSKGVLVPVSESSDIFDDILTPLQNAYLYEESKHSFRYKSAFLIKNDTLQEKYDAFRVKRRAAGYSEEDLKDSYGFLLFDDLNKAKRLGETGVLTGNCTCTTLGDPSKGVYISKHSDCLDLNRWYHGKSGFIVIIRLTKGRVKKVSENYTQNFTAPSVGFDCHESEQLSAVSANTSSFLAFERTQYYMYELLHNENNEMAQESPSHACPFAIVSFSYADTKAKPSEPQAKSVEEKKVFYYLPWSGQLKISSQLYYVGLKSTTGALIPAKLSYES
ncbi:protein TASOR isoform 2-T2 [Polymixia lowei]